MRKKFDINAIKAQRLARLAQIELEIAEAEENAKKAYLEYKKTNNLDFMNECSRQTKIGKELKSERNLLKIMTQDKFYACEVLYSDVHAYEVVEEKSEKVLIVRRLDVKRTEESIKKMQESFVPCGFVGRFDNDLQEWIYTSNENNRLTEIRLHKDGRYYEAGSSIPFVLKSVPYEHYDFNF